MAILLKSCEKDILDSERVCDRHFISFHGTSTISIGFQLYISVKWNSEQKLLHLQSQL